MLASVVPSFVSAEEVPYGPWVDEIRFESGFEEAILFDKMSKGEMHLYIKDWTDVDLLEQIKISPELEYATSFGLFYELTFNPVGPTFPKTGKFNPFVNEKIREAMNMLVDRDYIVDELMKGLAKPKLLPIVSAFPDYGRLAETAVLLENKYKYDPDNAEEIIIEELEGMGAELVDGKWTYDGEVVTLKMLIRTEDQRKEIGDYVSDLLEGGCTGPAPRPRRYGSTETPPMGNSTSTQVDGSAPSYRETTPITLPIIIPIWAFHSPCIWRTRTTRSSMMQPGDWMRENTPLGKREWI